jgi:ABC-type phosphate transport system permease subunit
VAVEVPSAPGDVARRPLRRKRIRPADALFHGFALAAVLVALGALVWLLVSIVMSGAPALAWSFLTHAVSTNPDRAGFYSALRGSLVLMIIVMAVAIPIGFAAAIYLEKFAAISRAQLTSVALLKRRRLREAEEAGLSGPLRALQRLRVALCLIHN